MKARALLGAMGAALAALVVLGGRSASAAPPPSGGTAKKKGVLADGSLDPEFRSATVEVATERGIEPGMLLAVMALETGWTMDPAIRNPQSGAVGLIQFLHPAALKVAGATKDELAAMTAVEQLNGPVRRYFAQFGSFAGRDHRDAYLAVFAPAGIGRPDGFVLYAGGTKAYEQNRGLDKDGDGQITAGDVRRSIEGVRNKVLSRWGL